MIDYMLIGSDDVAVDGSFIGSFATPNDRLFVGLDDVVVDGSFAMVFDHQFLLQINNKNHIYLLLLIGCLITFF